MTKEKFEEELNKIVAAHEEKVGISVIKITRRANDWVVHYKG